MNQKSQNRNSRNRNSQPVPERLAAGPKRGLGSANEIANEAVASSVTLQRLVDALDDPRPLVVARAANALKKVQEASPRVLDVFARRLVRQAMACEVLEARWNLTIVVGRLQPEARDRALATGLLFESLTSPSVFQRVFALQSLVDLSADDPLLRSRLQPVVRNFLENGTAAMKARARKLLPLVESRAGQP